LPVFRLSQELIFPDVQLTEDGLLAVGGDLSLERLLLAYKSGIFPWYNKDEPILWWSPDPRFILFPNDLKVSKSMKLLLKRQVFRVTENQCFEEVMRVCGEMPREGQDGTWINEDMVRAYVELHKNGYAHSVEVWEDDKLVGGLYGVLLGKVFFGESMFYRVSNASKYGFIVFVEKLKSIGVELIDCQVPTPHLASLGAKNIKREEFIALLRKLVK
jgi:leucyl/phenylalanyl-tRNA---protein transferase